MVSARTLRLTSYYQLAVMLLAFAASCWWWPNGAVALLVGGLLMGANFWALRFLAARALQGSRPRVAYAVALGVKMVLVLAISAWLVLALDLDVLGFATGMSTLLAAVGLATWHGAMTAESVDPKSQPAC